MGWIGDLEGEPGHEDRIHGDEAVPGRGRPVRRADPVVHRHRHGFEGRRGRSVRQEKGIADGDVPRRLPLQVRHGPPRRPDHHLHPGAPRHLHRAGPDLDGDEIRRRGKRHGAEEPSPCRRRAGRRQDRQPRRHRRGGQRGPHPPPSPPRQPPGEGTAQFGVRPRERAVGVGARLAGQGRGDPRGEAPAQLQGAAHGPGREPRRRLHGLRHPELGEPAARDEAHAQGPCQRRRQKEEVQHERAGAPLPPPVGSRHPPGQGQNQSRARPEPGAGHGGQQRRQAPPHCGHAPLQAPRSAAHRGGCPRAKRKVFTPIRSARSRSSGGSPWTSGSSQPSPRSDSWL